MVTILKSLDGWKFETGTKSWFVPKKWFEELIQRFSKINIQTVVFRKEEDTKEKLNLLEDNNKQLDCGHGLKRKKAFHDDSNQVIVIHVLKSFDSFFIKLPIDPMAYFSLKRKEFLVWDDNTTWKEKDHHDEFFKACDVNFIKINYLN